MKQESVVLVGGDLDGVVYVPPKGITCVEAVNAVGTIRGGVFSDGTYWESADTIERVAYKPDPNDPSRWVMEPSTHVCDDSCHLSGDQK